MSASTLVSLHNLSIQFPLYSKSTRSLKKTLLSGLTGGRIREGDHNRIVVEALSDITFDLKEGDRLGLVGHNGAGKTTLLRVLSGVYEPTRGTIAMRGRVAPLFEIGLGLEGDATGFENIRLRGMLYGMSPGEMDALAPSIAEFSGLGQYMSMPLRTYSTGMTLRLAFSIATCMDPEILLLDEWIATGDADFLKRAQQRMEEIVGRSKVLVLASHDMKLIQRTCNKVLCLDHGRVTAFGPPSIVLPSLEESRSVSEGI
ncbi:MAG: ABC transporter ATP-binding protein [Alphaproteobacteria bacterium]|nr:MAG: ABC transporter ATP-binding protein [Alphaproteobacteria bacterium]